MYYALPIENCKVKSSNVAQCAINEVKTKMWLPSLMFWKPLTINCINFARPNDFSYRMYSVHATQIFIGYMVETTKLREKMVCTIMCMGCNSFLWVTIVMAWVSSWLATVLSYISYCTSTSGETIHSSCLRSQTVHNISVCMGETSSGRLLPVYMT